MRVQFCGFLPGQQSGVFSPQTGKEDNPGFSGKSREKILEKEPVQGLFFFRAEIRISRNKTEGVLCKDISLNGMCPDPAPPAAEVAMRTIPTPPPEPRLFFPIPGEDRIRANYSLPCSSG